jgi:pSer/pThr/pTyr-binding forkhead associated (FHA) protein
MVPPRASGPCDDSTVAISFAAAGAMPIFVIYARGEPALRATVDGSPVRVGRDATSDIALPSETVSRDHAVFVEDEHGHWHVGCVSDTNPVVVDGVLVTRTAPVVDGTHVGVGSEHLVVFCTHETSARRLLGQQGGLGQHRCQRCRWAGLVSVLHRAACPRCGAQDMRSLDEYRPNVKLGGDDTTVPMAPQQAKDRFQGLRAAKRSRLERIDGREEEPKPLSEHAPLLIGGNRAAFKLHGLTLGHVRVTWSGRAWIAESALKFPALKVNGTQVETARLQHGDVIEIGPNRFRFVTE